MKGKSDLTMIGHAPVDDTLHIKGTINIIRGGGAIYLQVDEEEDGEGEEQEIFIQSEFQAQAVVDAIRGIAASQGWKVD